jgi:hypothetical protein
MDSRSQEAHVTSTVVQTTPEVSPEKYDLVIIGSVREPNSPHGRLASWDGALQLLNVSTSEVPATTLLVFLQRT